MIRNACFALALSGLAGCVTQDEHRTIQAANEALRHQLSDLQAHQLALQNDNQRLTSEVLRLGQSAVVEADVQRQKERLAELIRKFEAGGASAIPGITALRTAEGVAFRAQGEILFEPGQAKLTAQGEATLRQLVPTLRQHDGAIRIDGHTDSDRIVHSPWKTNLRLSSERSLSVVEFLIAQGLDPHKLHASAFGEYRPAVAGDSAENKRANRRVELLLVGG